MPDRSNHAAAGRAWWTSAAVAGLVALAWTGILDNRSTDYIDGALIASGAVYAAARGINAIVSVLQGTEMNAFIITFTVGELLDPVNDLVERFSGVMMIAIGSLALQKILLEVVSHQTFNLLLTLLGGGVIGTSLLGLSGRYRIISRLFFVTVVIRFSLAMVVVANSWVDRIFLAENEAERLDNIKLFQSELELIGSRAGLNLDIDHDRKKLEADIARNREVQGIEREAVRSSRSQLARAERELDAMDDRSLWETLTGEKRADIEDKKAEIERIERLIRDTEQSLAALGEREQALKERLECLEQRASGESCSLADSMSSALAAVDVKRRIEALGERVDEFASNLINLLMSLVLKSILLPIVFIYVLLNFVRSHLAGR
jgi:hypothetical protein